MKSKRVPHLEIILSIKLLSSSLLEAFNAMILLGSLSSFSKILTVSKPLSLFSSCLGKRSTNKNSNSPLIRLLARSTDSGLTKLRNLSFSSSEIVLSVVVSTLNCAADNKQLSINFLLKSIISFSFLNLFKLI